MRLSTYWLASCVALFLSASPAWGGLVALESFDYPLGPLASNNGGEGDWTAPWTGIPASTVVSKSMSYASGPITISGGTTAMRYSGGDSFTLASRPFAQHEMANGPLYVSFLLETSTGGGGADDFFAIYPQNSSLAATTADDYGVVLRKQADLVTRFGVRSADGGGQNFGGPNVLNDQTYLVVLKIDYPTTANQLTMFINPESLDEASEIDAIDGGGVGFSNNINRFTFRAALGGGTYFIDELRVGDTFASVLAVPEPGSVSLLVAGLVTIGPLFFARRRGRRPPRNAR